MGSFKGLSDHLQELLKKGASPPKEGPGKGNDVSGVRELDLMLQEILKKGALSPTALDALTRQGPRGVLMLNPGHVRALITKAIEDAAGKAGKTPEQGPHALLIMDRDWLAAEISAVREILSARAQAEAAERRHEQELSKSASDNRVLQERQDQLRVARDMAAEQARLEASLQAAQAREAESRAQSRQLAQDMETLRQKLLEAERQKTEAETRSEGALVAVKGSLEAQVQALQAREAEALARAQRATTELRDLQVQSQGSQKQVAEALVEAQRELREAAARQAEAGQRFQEQARELQDQLLAAERDKSSMRAMAEQTQARLAALQERLEAVQAGEREAKGQADRADGEIRRLREQLLSLEREKGAAVAAAEQGARETATREGAAALEERVREFQAREASAQAHMERLVAELQELRQRHPNVGSDEMEGLLNRFKADLTLELSRRDAPPGRTPSGMGNLQRAIISSQVDRALEEPVQGALDDRAFATRRSGSSRRLSRTQERLQSIQEPGPKAPEEEPKEKGE